MNAVDYSEASIIICARNEEATIAPCLRAVHHAVPQAEIVVVDGGTDETYARASALKSEISRLVVVNNEDDRGKGHAIRVGMTHAQGRVAAQFDADLQFVASDLPAVLGPVLSGACDVCIGSRFRPGADRTAYRPIFLRDAGNALLSGLISLLAGQKVTDATAGIKAWTRLAFDRMALEDDRYSYEAEIIVKAAGRGLRIQEVPVTYASRTEGESMHRSTAALIRAGATIAAKSIRWRVSDIGYAQRNKKTPQP